ncbi:MAG TPA: hypothetical protein VM911_14290 [Pyrinomonadaceae bacterium]|nr:hypothetical protein [Pyrinomonadaceae bacterium]
MNITGTLLACIALLTLHTPQRRPVDYGLPQGARVIETRVINTKAHPNRMLVLWMLRPKTNPRGAEEDVYTCPEETRGSHYSGPTRVSLVDTAQRRVINTVEVRPEYESGSEDSFDIPYKIHRGYYHVAGVRGQAEGRPTVMWLKDFNGDGRAHEFALFEAWACMGLQTTLIGYSERQDKVIQYETVLEIVEEGNKHSVETLRWVDYLFGQKPVAPRRWKYQIDYRGRGGTLDRYEIRYDVAREKFEGKLTVQPE